MLYNSNHHRINPQFEHCLIVYIFLILLFLIVNKCNGDIKQEMFYWNLNNITAIFFSLQIPYFNSITRFGIMNLLEVYLDSAAGAYNDYFGISHNILIQSNLLSNAKEEGVFIYYLIRLPLKSINIKYLQEYKTFETQIGHKKISLYHYL